MKCDCGSVEFSHCGMQEVPPDKDGKPGKPVQLVNCLGCGTTLSVPKTSIGRYYDGKKPMIGDLVQSNDDPNRLEIIINIEKKHLFLRQAGNRASKRRKLSKYFKLIRRVPEGRKLK